MKKRKTEKELAFGKEIELNYSEEISHKNSNIDEISYLEEALSILKNIAQQRNDKSSFQNILGMNKTIEQLKDRIKRNDLPLAAIHKTFHEVRLEALLLSVNIQIQAMYDRQILMAPKPEWREQIRAEHNDLTCWYDLEKDDIKKISEMLESQLQAVLKANSILLKPNEVQ